MKPSSGPMGKIIRLAILLSIAGFAAYLYSAGGKEYLNLSFIQQKLGDFRVYQEEYPWKTGLIFFGAYVLATALSLPGATVLTLLAGALFGPLRGVVIVSFASTVGAFLAFLASRFLLRDMLLQKFRKQFKTIDASIQRDGPLYLLTLRLVPIFPFFIVNLVMGLTAIKSFTFYWVSQLGMLPGTAVYVYAGKELSEISSLKGIMSPGVLLAFTLLGLLPLIGKFISNAVKSRKVYQGFTKPKSFDYNLVAIGGGSAGLVSTYIGAAVKARVALIEKHKMGGDCLNTGCVPSKALIKSAKVVQLQHKAQEFGLKKITMDFDFAEVMDRIQRVIKEIEPHDSVERYESLGVECIQGEAKLISPWEIEVNGKTITSKNIVIATGASPAVPKIPGLAEAKFVTSDNLWEIRELPKKFLVMGGGPIGAEMAQAFARLGSQVTLIEGGPRILNKEDPQVSDLVTQVFKEEGVRVLTSHLVKSFTKDNGRDIVICEHAGSEVRIDFDLILVAVGRRARTKGFGLEELGVKLRDNGTIDANEMQQTSVPNIYACGDVAGPYQLTHMAAHQAWYCAVNSLFPKKFKIDYSAVPWSTYTDPEVATVGETEESAKAKEMEYEVTEYDLSDLDRAIAEGDKHGFVRVITEKGKDRILGATIVGAQASTMIMEFITAMKHKKGMNSILGTIHVYPSFGEANKYAAGQWKKAHASESALRLLEKYFKWKRA